MPVTLVIYEESSGVTLLNQEAPGIVVSSATAPGLPGAPGQDGVDGGHYTHIQAGLNTVWVVQHNLGYRPAGILAFDDVSGNRIHGLINHVSDNIFTITYLQPFSGYAYVS